MGRFDQRRHAMPGSSLVAVGASVFAFGSYVNFTNGLIVYVFGYKFYVDCQRHPQRVALATPITFPSSNLDCGVVVAVNPVIGGQHVRTSEPDLVTRSETLRPRKSSTATYIVPIERCLILKNCASHEIPLAHEKPEQQECQRRKDVEAPHMRQADRPQRHRDNDGVFGELAEDDGDRLAADRAVAFGVLEVLGVNRRGKYARARDDGQESYAVEPSWIDAWLWHEGFQYYGIQQNRHMAYRLRAWLRPQTRQSRVH